MILWLFGIVPDNVNSFALPSPVKLSTLWSVISKVSIVSPIKLPQNTSFDDGAFLNTIFSLSMIENPSVKVPWFTLGLWITLLIAMFNCEGLTILIVSPLSWVSLNFVLTPSNAAFNVWELPEPTDDKLILLFAFAFTKDVASFIVCAVSKVT